MRRAAAALGSTIVLALGLVACGDSGTPVSTEAFCSRLADLRQRNPLEDAVSDQAAADEVAAILDDLISTSPQQVRSDLRTFRRLVDDLRNLDSSDPQAAEDAVAGAGHARRHLVGPEPRRVRPGASAASTTSSRPAPRRLTAEPAHQSGNQVKESAQDERNSLTQ